MPQSPDSNGLGSCIPTEMGAIVPSIYRYLATSLRLAAQISRYWVALLLTRLVPNSDNPLAEIPLLSINANTDEAPCPFPFLGGATFVIGALLTVYTSVVQNSAESICGPDLVFLMSDIWQQMVL